MKTDRLDSEGGSAILMVLVVVVLAAALMTGLVRTGSAAAARAEAQAAADAVSLAGAAAGMAAADAAALRNDAVLVTYREDLDDVEVTVEHDGVTAVARARGIDIAIP